MKRARLLHPDWFKPNDLIDHEVTEAIAVYKARVYEEERGKTTFFLIVIDGGKNAKPTEPEPTGNSAA